MRKVLVCALMISLCLLTGCGQGDGGSDNAEELALQIRTELIDMTSCQTAVTVTADYGERVYDFGMDATYDSTTGGVLTVTAPELVAGVTARIAGGSTLLEYDGASLETGDLSGEGLSPMEALPALLEFGRSGYMAQCGYENRDGQDTLHVVYRNPEAEAGVGVEAGIWFDIATHAPVAAELYSEGYLVIDCRFEGFTAGEQ